MVQHVSTDDHPTVSVIIPVFNDEEYLSKALRAIIGQVRKPSSLEIIVVDNGSTDHSIAVAQSHEGVKVILEHDNLRSPYSARNRGIEAASGEVIVLLDANCYPSDVWIEHGLRALVDLNADIVAGEVKFSFDERISAGKIYDSLTSVNMQASVEENSSAPTANLFIKRSAFDAVGLFPEGIRSGGDIIWTKRCVANGFILKYSKNAVVYKRARPFSELIKKKWRVGKGKAFIWFCEDGGVSLKRYLRTFRFLFPPRIRGIVRLIDKRGDKSMKETKCIVGLMLVAYSIRLVTFTAIFAGAVRLRNSIRASKSERGA